jgi:hypothetical protein
LIFACVLPLISIQAGTRTLTTWEFQYISFDLPEISLLNSWSPPAFL